MRMMCGGCGPGMGCAPNWELWGYDCWGRCVCVRAHYKLLVLELVLVCVVCIPVKQGMCLARLCVCRVWRRSGYLWDRVRCMFWRGVGG